MKKITSQEDKFKEAFQTWNNSRSKQTRVRKVPVKSADEIIANHAWSTPKYNHFAEEIYQQQKTDKFFNRILTVGYIICAICAIILVIVNIK